VAVLQEIQELLLEQMLQIQEAEQTTRRRLWLKQQQKLEQKI
jgi:hypothetical protein